MGEHKSISKYGKTINANENYASKCVGTIMLLTTREYKTTT